ncbi:Prophage tail length tape measure protein [Novosphingobium sp. CF614]|nr:Prophage tail length tape measure protein [Novosphingobium sp. CF614]
MSDRTVKLTVAFQAIDKLGATIKRLAAGSKGLARDMVALKREAKSLEYSRDAIGKVGQLGAGISENHKALDVMRRRMRELKTEIDQSKKPVGALWSEYRKLENQEIKLSTTTSKQAQKLKVYQDQLRSAGVDVNRLADEEQRLNREIAANTTRLQQNERMLKRKQRMETMRDRSSKVADFAGGAATRLSVGVTAPVLAFAGASVNAARESNAATAQVRAGIESMGKASGHTFKQLQDQAGALMRTSLFDDDEILGGVTANLVTFGSISGKVFDRAQQAVIDYSARTGKDLQGSTIMFGKALNDPIKGLSALSRVGIQFTTQQKAMIKSMVAAGNIAGAQNLVLNELEREYRGSAKAARDADPGKAMALSFGEFEEAIGGRLLPRLIPLIDKLTALMDAFGNLSPGMQDFIIKGALIAAALGPVLGIVSGLATVFSLVAGAAAALGVGLLPMIAIVAAVAAVVGGAAYLIYSNWDTIKAKFEPLIDAISGAFAKLADFFANGKLAGPIAALVNIFKQAFGGVMMAVIDTFVGVVTAAFGIIGGVIDVVAGLLTGNWSQAWNGVKAIFSGGVAAIVAIFTGGVRALWSILSGAANALSAVGAAIMNGIWNGIMAGWGKVKSLVSSLASSLPEWLKGPLGIKSPSRIFMALGGHIADGLGAGIDKGRAHPIRAVGRMAAGVMAAGAVSLAPVHAAAAAPPPPPLAPMQSAALAGPSRMPGMPAAGPITINIYPAPGMDVKELAREVRRELERTQASQARSSFSDGH